ncbi:MAG: hypothetical protein BWY19_00787 [bacterium ADurb.Bin212]|nr:MAG: hypothetical protein BWY19_00787 [bacterium ADurb.Bin212]
MKIIGMKIGCCKEHKNLKLKYQVLKEGQELLWKTTESLNADKNKYKEAVENAIFWLSKIAQENDPELAKFGIKAVNQILNTIEAS